MPLSLPWLPRHLAALIRLAGLLLVVPLLLGADDSYLREIEDEVKRQATTLTTDLPQSGSAPTATAADTTVDRLMPGLDLAAFEQALRKSLPGTYTLYQQLSPAGKQQAHEFYRDDNRLANISGQITRLLGGTP